MWNEHRRFLLRCILDAAYFHMYLPSTSDGEWAIGEASQFAEAPRLRSAFPTPRHAVSHILDTFPLVRSSEEKTCGEYRTKDTVLIISDNLSESGRSEARRVSLVARPPADLSCCHSMG